MEPTHPDLLPDPDLQREAMRERQDAVARRASFRDDHAIDVDSIDTAVPASIDPPDPTVARSASAEDSDSPIVAPSPSAEESDSPTVVGVDQAFRDESVCSTAVAIRDGEVVATASAVEPITMPYVPGLLVFREGMAIVRALEALSVTPAVVCFDGSGRIHFRQAGLATHIGVVFDVPAVGIAKNLLCGRPRRSLEDPLPAGERVAIEADADVTANAGTVIGYAFQSRQFESDLRHVNPLYVSPGHRLSAETAVDVVAACGGAYKLPEPTRIADAMVARLTAEE
jgi:deoxyribonuclease V